MEMSRLLASSLRKTAKSGGEQDRISPNPAKARVILAMLSVRLQASRRSNARFGAAARTGRMPHAQPVSGRTILQAGPAGK